MDARQAPLDLRGQHRAKDLRAPDGEGKGDSSIHRSALWREHREKERVLEHNLWIDEKKKHIKVYDIKKIGWNGLAMSRSIGDKNCKEVSSERPRGKGGIIAIPEYHVIQLTPENNFLIIATDGLWVKVTDTKAIQVITLADISLRQKLQLKANKTPPDFFDTSAECDESIIAAAHILGAKALIKGSHDNIAIIIVQLKWQEI